MKPLLFCASVLAFFVSSEGQLNCGRHSQELFRGDTYIVGGNSVDIADSVVSFQVFKSDEWWNDNEWKHVCGGTLLNEKWVLTAAHCAREFREWGAARVSIGSVNLTETPDAQIVKVRRVIEHPNWKTQGAPWDVALIELQRAVQNNYYVSPACLNADKEDIVEGEPCATVGWGRVAENSEFSEALKAVHVNMMSYSQCMRAYRNMNGVRISPNHICAGRMGERGRGMCQGDLGGPLFCKTRYGVQLVGVATNGALCGSPQYPGVYIRIDEFIEWIRQTTNDWQIGQLPLSTTTDEYDTTELQDTSSPWY